MIARDHWTESIAESECLASVSLFSGHWSLTPDPCFHETIIRSASSLAFQVKETLNAPGSGFALFHP